MTSTEFTSSPSSPLVFLVTGTTSGIGLSLVRHILSRGDKVIATGRKVHSRLPEDLLLLCSAPSESSLADSKSNNDNKNNNLAILELDIASPLSVLKEKASEAWNIWGKVDVLVNNAGMSGLCSAEEASPEYIAQMFQVNFFGPLNLTQAFLPYFRAHAAASAAAAAASGSTGAGGPTLSPHHHIPRPILAYTASSSHWTPLPFMSHYASSKAALSTYVESLGSELKPLGIDVVAFECGGFPTNLGQSRGGGDDSGAAAAGAGSESSSFGQEGTKLPEVYGQGFAKLTGMWARDYMAFMPGDLEKVARTMVDVLKREEDLEDHLEEDLEEEKKKNHHKTDEGSRSGGGGGGLGLGGYRARTVVLGSDAWESVRGKCEQMLVLLDRWKNVSWGTDRDGVKGGADEEYLEVVNILGTGEE